MSISEQGPKPVVLVTDVDWDGLEIETQILSGLGYELLLAGDDSEETLIALAPKASIILVCFANLTPAVIAAATNTKAIFRYGVGLDNTGLAAATAAEIPVYHVPDYCVDEVADHALLLMLAIYRGLPAQLETMRAGGWSMPEAYPTRISGLTLGLVGMGRTAQALARRAGALGMNVVFTSSRRQLPSGLAARYIENLAEFLTVADCVSLHIPLNPETQNLVDSNFLARMKQSAVLINVSRGGLVNSDDLLVALRSGTIAAAGLDVTNPEPLPAAHPLRELRQCLITPHFAYRSKEAMTELRLRIASGAKAFLSGDDPAQFVTRAN